MMAYRACWALGLQKTLQVSNSRICRSNGPLRNGRLQGLVTMMYHEADGKSVKNPLPLSQGHLNAYTFGICAQLSSDFTIQSRKTSTYSQRVQNAADSRIRG